MKKFFAGFVVVGSIFLIFLSLKQRTSQSPHPAILKTSGNANVYISTNYGLGGFAEVNHRPCNISIDTGAKYCITYDKNYISSEDTHSNELIADVQGNLSYVQHTKIKNLTLGSIQWNSLEGLIVSRGPNNECELALGNNAFQENVLILDLSKHQIQVCKPSVNSADETTFIPFTSLNDKTEVPGSIITTGYITKKPYKISIDTGCAYDMIVCEKVIHSNQDDKVVSITTLNGEQEAHESSVTVKLTIDHVELTAKPVIVSTLPNGIDIILGASALLGKRLTIDYHSRKLHIQSPG